MVTTENRTYPKPCFPYAASTKLVQTRQAYKELTVLRRSAHRDAHASRPYSKTNRARCALWCLRDDIFEQYLERQLTFRQRQMADLYSREQCFSSVKIYKDLTVFDIEALCFRSQLKKRRTPSRVPFFHEGDFSCVVS